MTFISIISIFLYVLTQFLTSAIKIDSHFLLQPERLPRDLNFMPSLSNGHLGFTVFGDAIYMNGVYNGYKGDSRRARLPNWLNITAKLLNPQTNTYIQSNFTKYTLNLYKGVYEWIEEFPDNQLRIQQRVYAHRFYNRALIYELRVEQNLRKDSTTIELELNPGCNSNAFDIIPVSSDTSNITLLHGITKELENENFQTNQTSLYVAFSEHFVKNKKILNLAAGKSSLYYRYVLTADLLKAISQVLSLNESDVFETHVSCWMQFWNNFQIEVRDNDELKSENTDLKNVGFDAKSISNEISFGQKYENISKLCSSESIEIIIESQTINAAIFYMGNSLPSIKTNQENNPYFGLSPTGLGRGQLDDDYEGHSFWDTEIWMMPVVTQLNIHWTQELFKYRLDHLQGALYNANTTGYKGARFPWESAYTGTEVTNPCCPEVATQQIHISADIAVALQQFYATSYNRDWLCHTAWPLVREIVAYLQSRVTWNKQTNQYHIKNVMGPDEDHENVDDNVYTNVVFKQAFMFARLTHLECAPNANDSSLEWLNISNNMFLLYDRIRNYHPQHLNYLPGQQVKQADTILLGYPLQFVMANSTRFNDLSMYESVSRLSGPAMTWSMFAINFLDIGLKDKADFYFFKGYTDYVRPEFKVWSETKIGFMGSANFLTGIGGFLQSIINGYAGIRFQLHNNTAKMLIKQTNLLPNTTELTIKGIKFAGSIFDLHIKNTGLSTIKCLKLNSLPLEIKISDGKPAPLFTNVLIQFKTELITIQTTNSQRNHT